MPKSIDNWTGEPVENVPDGAATSPSERKSMTHNTDNSEPMSRSEAEIRKALEAGLPDGWHAPGLAEVHDGQYRVIASCVDVDPVPEAERPVPDVHEGDRIATYVAACNPAAIRSLLDELDALRAAAVPVPAVQGGQVAAPVAPPGWKLVPIEPSPEMLGAVLPFFNRANAMNDACSLKRQPLTDAQIYSAMIEAAPLYAGAPPVVQELSDERIRELIAEHLGGGGDLMTYTRAILGAAQERKALHGFDREDLDAIADGLDGYDKTVNVGEVTGEGDQLLESTTAAAARFIRAVLKAATSPQKD